MARKRSGSLFFLLLIFLLIAGGGVGYVVFFTDLLATPSQKAPVVKDQSQDSEILTRIDPWMPEVVWEKPKKATKEVYYGLVNGQERTGTLVDKDGHIDRFEDIELLEKNGFTEDLNLAVDTQTGSMWGYGKTVGDNMQIVVISYENKDIYPNAQGVSEADCPCTLTVSVYESDAFKPNWKESEL